MNPTITCALLICLGLSVGTVSGQPRSPDELPLLFEELASPDLEIKNNASHQLGAYAKWWIQQDVEVMRKSLPYALRALKSPDSGVRKQASAFFGIVGMLRTQVAARIFEGYIDEIIAHFGDPNDQVRGNMIRSLATMEPSPPQEAIEPFLEMLRQTRGRGEGGKNALFGLLRAAPGSEEVAKTIANILDESTSAEARRGIILVVAQARPQQPHPLIIEKLIEQLEVDHRLLRFTTSRALGAIGAAAVDAVPKLRAIVDDPETDDDLRITVEAALRSIEGRPPPNHPR